MLECVHSVSVLHERHYVACARCKQNKRMSRTALQSDRQTDRQTVGNTTLLGVSVKLLTGTYMCVYVHVVCYTSIGRSLIYCCVTCTKGIKEG